MKLEQEEETIQKGGEGCRKKSAALVEDDAASDNRKDIGDRKKAFLPTSKIDQARNEKVINHNLKISKSLEVFNFSK
jgi:hypothetical protein